MRSVKVLEMINQGRIEELKGELRDEIYADALKNNPSAKKRYAAMKKYFTYIKTTREALQKPCIVEFNGMLYTSFCNSHSLALTTEPCGSIELFADTDRYPDVARLITTNGKGRKVDFQKVFADAKSQGYHLKKSELDGHKFKYLMHYDGSYFKLGLVDATFSIIDDGEEATVYHDPVKRLPITIETSIGVCTIMPMNIKNEDDIEDGITIIDVKEAN